MAAALAAISFHGAQAALQAQVKELQLGRKVERVQDACKKRLAEVHSGYTQARRRAAAAAPRRPAAAARCTTPLPPIRAQPTSPNVLKPMLNSQ